MGKSKGVAKKEIALGAIRGAIGAIPFAGTAINEALFDVSARIKQERLNRFVELLAEYFSHLSSHEFDLSNTKSEEFVDLMESVIRRVVRTRKQEKLEMLRDVVLFAMAHKPIEPERVESFLDVIERVDTIHMKILSFFYEREGTDMEGHLRGLRLAEAMKQEAITGAKEMAQKRLLEFSAKLHDYEKRFNELITSLESEESNTEFYLQDLIAKGLLLDIGAGATNYKPLHYLRISRYGAEFFCFVTRRPINDVDQREMA